MIVLLELLTALLEYIDLILQLSFFQQELYKYLTYYAGIMLNAFRYLLCSKLCQHNRRVPTLMYTTMIYLDLWKGADYYDKITCTWLPGDKKEIVHFMNIIIKEM